MSVGLFLAALGQLILTVAGGNLTLPRLSPDGLRLAYARGNEVRVVLVATRQTDVVIPARYGALRELEWTDDNHIAASFARNRIVADVISKRRTSSKPPAIAMKPVAFCDTTLRATTDRDSLTLWRTSGTSTLPLATIYPADHGSLELLRTTPREVIFLVRVAPRGRIDATNHLMSYDGVRLHAYGIDGLEDASFSNDGHRIAIDVWVNAQRRLLVFDR
ncbi:MAG TPA: hypothetical protein VJ901_08855 [Thermoanaerobaculia bacterium]|nr:hypothetical protein [Thermoanaerobaculia bacterium]